MGNFTYLKEHPLYSSFSSACIEAEAGFKVSYDTAAILSRKALELAVKWLYTHDNDLQLPYDNSLSALIHAACFKDVIDMSHFKGIKFIKDLGNRAVHSSKGVDKEQAVFSLKALHRFVGWIDYCYSDVCTNSVFDESLLPDSNHEKRTKEQLTKLFDRMGEKDRQLEEMVRQNEELMKQLAAAREANQLDQSRSYQKEDLSEFRTRKIYIDLDLELAGWTLGKDCIEEVEVSGMPSDSGIGKVDYVLYADNGLPLAVVEAKRTSVDPHQGRIQAKLYADCLERQHGYRPVMFTTNGFRTFYHDDRDSTEREVSGFFTKDDMDWRAYRRAHKQPLKNLQINEEITNRPYQKMAIQSVCETFEKGQDKALLVMATGSGKTRTAISIVDVLLRRGWVKNILFLADRRELVKQAKNAFNNLLPELSLCNLLDSKDSPESKMVFSTYPTMMNAIDATKDKTGNRLFSPGHFDLIIIDESHRSIYKKYQDIFTYYDSALVGLTATPKSDIHKDTYALFELEKNVPTFAYDLEEAIEQKYLVPYQTIETQIKLPEEGIHYDDLSEEEKEHYEETFEEEFSQGIKDFSGDEINTFLFNQQTVDIVWEELFTRGLKIEGGDKLGKTIIFAKNKKHAEFIYQRFNVKYKQLTGSFTSPIYTGLKYVDKAFDDFKTGDKHPQVAISVDMLDTGVDVPEILNLVFFKKVRSVSKFKQMIGRGTRLCENLLGPGQDKECFRIFDYCSNFEFFRERKKTPTESDPISLSARLFNIKTRIVKELQHLEYQNNEEYLQYRELLKTELFHQTNRIDQNHFSARLRIKYIHLYTKEKAWHALGDTDLMDLKQQVAPLVPPWEGEESAKRFDLLMYSIEYATLAGFRCAKEINQVVSTAEKLAEKGNIQEIRNHKDIIERIQTKEFWDNADIMQHEEVRNALRELLKYFDENQRRIYFTDFDDEIISTVEHEMGAYGEELISYRKKVMHFLKEHENDRTMVIYKLRHNLELTEKDINDLEQILWHDLGTKEDYEKIYSQTPLLKLVASLVGMDQEAVNQAFSNFLSDETLNLNQMEFVKMIVSHIIQNGYINKEDLNEQPFDKYGSIIHLFDGRIDIAQKIVGQIDKLNGRLDVS